MGAEVWVARFARWHQPREVRCGSRGEALGLLAHVWEYGEGSLVALEGPGVWVEGEALEEVVAAVVDGVGL